MAECSTCSTVTSNEAKNWPDATISTKMTMNPYLMAMAEEEALKKGMRLWEYVNLAIWEKLGKPEQETLMEFAANLEPADDEPKWKKRLKVTARFEVEKEEFIEQMKQTAEKPGNGSTDNQDPDNS